MPPIKPASKSPARAVPRSLRPSPARPQEGNGKT